MILLIDSNYWRSGCSSFPWHNRKTNVKQDTNGVLDRLEISLLSDGNDKILSKDLQTLIEKNRCKFIDFAHISISSTLVGSGSYSRVYAGKYKNKPVAIKFFLRNPTEITPETIKLFSKEMVIASALQDECIVKFYG
jgi:hypothetical protein